MLKIGIAGKRGLNLLSGFRNIQDVEVQAFCDLDEETVDEQAKKFGIRSKYRIFEDMLDSDIDAVVIATPNQLHVPQTIQALEAGKHVLCEVTAGVTIDELWWLIESVEKYRKVYMMAENYCYIPEIKILENMVNKGMFGEVYFGVGEYLQDIKSLLAYPNGKTSWRKFWQLGKRGAFYPTHSLGPLMKLFGDDHIVEVSCFGSGWHTSPEIRQEDTSITICRLKSGKLIILRVDCISKRPDNYTYYSIQGTKGCYEAPRAIGEGHKIWLDDMAGDSSKAEWKALDLFIDHLPVSYKGVTEEQKKTGIWKKEHVMADDFIKAVVTGTKPAVDVYEACEWTAVGLLSELSVMNNGRTMEMPLFGKNMIQEDKNILL